MYADSMQVSTSENTEYCKNLIKTHDYARYLQCAFLPEIMRDAAYGYYALDAELAHVHHVVSEEMIGHIRYAWWQESIEGLNTPAQRQHPVLLTLAGSGIEQEALALVISYREVYPELPEVARALEFDNEKWRRAGQVIAAHGQRYGNGAKLWLIIKLLLT